MLDINAADVAVSAGVGLCATGVMIAVVQLLIAESNRRADQRANEPQQPAPRALDRFLDGLTEWVLGPKRLDHEPLYSCTISAVFLVGVFWLSVGPLPNSVIFTLPPSTQVLLAVCLLTGSGTCLYGISMGTATDVWRATVRISRGLSRRERPPLLPVDIRRSYRVGASGIISVFVGLSYYAAILVRDTPLGWTGANVLFLLFVCLGLVFQWLRFLMENRRINKTLPMLIAQEVHRRTISMEIGTDGSVDTRPLPRQERT